MSHRHKYCSYCKRHHKKGCWARDKLRRTPKSRFAKWLRKDFDEHFKRREERREAEKARKGVE